ncbi:MAG TPA: Ig-like domain-containing domain [Flavitalea sp.]|nr:Ig-like domain-containing domain [Flavitalea sp.]
MRAERSLFIIGCFFLLASSIFSGSSCASIIPPSGGPRDSLPPMLRSVSPADSSTKLVPKKITFVFDEFIEVDNPIQNVLISPTPKIFPVIQSKLRTLTVEIKDTLEPNTTYTFNFGNSIRDINEQNIKRDFIYIFSTGDALDSLELSGRVILAETGKTDSTIIVLLHSNLQDSAVINDQPRYRARLDSSGNFRFTNLPHGTFALYALDNGGGGRYMDKTKLFAFADKPINTASSTNEPIVLYAYSEKEVKQSTGLTGRPVPSRTAPNAQDRRLRMEVNLIDGQLDLLSNLEINFPTPLRYFDSAKAVLVNENFTPLPGARYIKDTTNQKITLNYRWIPNTQYHIIVDKDFAEDTTGRKLLKNDTLSFRTRKENEYGVAKLRFRNVDLLRNPVVLFVQNGAITYSHALTSREFTAPIFKPGEYELRVLYDENKNGKWDPGEFFGKRKQPEKVVTLPRRYTVRANFDNEVDITL